MLSAQRAAVLNGHALKSAALSRARASLAQDPTGGGGGGADAAAAAAAHAISWQDALWLATAGGAAALGLAGVVGCFRTGMSLDALVVDAAPPGGAGPELLPGHQEPLELLEAFLCNGDDRHIMEVYVGGARVVCKEPSA